ncbi:methyl-accepting chemotaxis protein [Nocardioides sp. GY 10113]|uniref:methyl-accepting chemotaxis protein n=1 Tax=Nocardioides sp. GY 10113 TaxID=2569761 RepID=UPI0010A83E2C|nr:methyl-accepting chemotaxis protein [Nocardioides sp. GY 10113]TIC85010.1 methyl-accepting chemotaxis protein [Nocardioides sp. GY 10113]
MDTTDRAHVDQPRRRRLADLSLGQKIAAPIVVVLLSAIVAAGVGFWTIARLAEVRDQELGHSVPYLSTVEEIRVVAKGIANDERGLLLTQDPEFADSITEKLQQVDELFVTAADHVPDGEGPLLAQARADVAAWEESLGTVMDMALTDVDGATRLSLSETRDLRKVYEATLETARDNADAIVRRGAGFEAAAGTSRLVLILTVVIGLLVSCAIGVRLVRNVLARIRRQAEALEALAAGDLTVRVDDPSGDELAQMAASLDAAAGSIRTMLSGILTSSDDLTAQASTMAATAQRIADSAEESASHAQGVSAAAAQVTQNVQTVATGTEEMSASSREISQNTSSAAGVASQAVSVAQTTSDTVVRLGESSAEVGNVISVIQSIAQQTNLLALNATIEAGRAGEAGKGFAVVASEVKELALETARATGDIDRRISAIQSDTQAAVHAITQIAGIIDQINDTQVSIASAVEEQTATTDDMARNVTEAAGGSEEISRSLGVLAGLASDTSHNAAITQDAAAGLARTAEDLRGQVGRFRL